jgi:hypothetical protein
VFLIVMNLKTTFNIMRNLLCADSRIRNALGSVSQIAEGGRLMLSCECSERYRFFVPRKCVILKTYLQRLYVSSHTENVMCFTGICFVVSMLKSNRLVRSTEKEFKSFSIILPSFPLSYFAQNLSFPQNFLVNGLNDFGTYYSPTLPLCTV